MAFSASCGQPIMLTDPSESFDASPQIFTFKTRGLAGGADSFRSADDPDLGRGEATEIEAGADPSEGGTLLNDPRRRNEERDPDKAARICSSEKLNSSVSESDGTLTGSFWVPVDPSEQVDLEGRVETRVFPLDPEDLADRPVPVDRGLTG
uniref:Uncharacterized protein n=1 Tax=Peronospora matthiolae TaxID=2874970 RepID=A0AAV1T1X3_9STRA